MIDIYMTCYLVEECEKKDKKPKLHTLHSKGSRRGLRYSCALLRAWRRYSCALLRAWRPYKEHLYIRIMCRP
jgi:hypothetical protein